MNEATAFAPATIANLGPGFDLLGLAIEQPGDTIRVKRIPEKKVVFVSDPAFPELPSDRRNVVYHVAQRLYDIIRPECGIEVHLVKKIPVASGMGGSAAGSAAAACAVNHLFNSPFTREQLLPFTMEGEEVASGSRHADNVAPALLGGLCLLSPGPELKIIRMPVANTLYWVVVHPEHRLDTRSMRKILPRTLPLETHTHQAGLLATLLTGLMHGNEEWIARGSSDLIAEPVRAAHIPGFVAVKKAATAAGAIGCGISGSGPAVFAITADAGSAAAVGQAMQQAFQKMGGLTSQTYISPVNTAGTVVSSRE